jgi:hypothetical protein
MEGLHSYMLSRLRMHWLSAPVPISDSATRSDKGQELGEMQETWMPKGVEGNRSSVLDTMKPGGKADRATAGRTPVPYSGVKWGKSQQGDGTQRSGDGFTARWRG